MALKIEVNLQVYSPDGSAQIILAQGDMTLNPAPGDWEIEAGIAKVAVTELLERLHDDAFRKLAEWAVIMAKLYPPEE